MYLREGASPDVYLSRCDVPSNSGSLSYLTPVDMLTLIYLGDSYTSSKLRATELLRME